jgi:hypothetical protein
MNLTLRGKSISVQDWHTATLSLPLIFLYCHDSNVVGSFHNIYETRNNKNQLIEYFQNHNTDLNNLNFELRISS